MKTDIPKRDVAKAVRAAKAFFNDFKSKRIPLSTGGELFFAPSMEALERHGYDATAAWAEYALHQVTSDNTGKGGEHYRVFNPEKVEKVLSQIEAIVAEDKAVVDRDAVLFFKQLDEKHIARMIARPINGNLRADDLREVTSTYSKGEIPATAVPLRRAVEERTSRGDIPVSTTDERKLAQRGGEVKNEKAQFYNLDEAGEAKREERGFINTSRGYTVAGLRNDSPYLQKEKQAKSEALFIPGNAGGSRLDAKSVTAVLKSLDHIASIAKRFAEVKGMFASIRAALNAMQDGRPVMRAIAKFKQLARFSVFW